MHAGDEEGRGKGEGRGEGGKGVRWRRAVMSVWSLSKDTGHDYHYYTSIQRSRKTGFPVPTTMHQRVFSQLAILACASHRHMLASQFLARQVGRQPRRGALRQLVGHGV